MDLLWWASWGAAGAFVYAAPRALVGLSETIAARKPLHPVIAQVAVAMVIGPICAAGLGPISGTWVHVAGGDGLRAVALVIGMIANPVSPPIVKLLGEGILRRVSAFVSGDKRE